jgi:hypothetical protein
VLMPARQASKQQHDGGKATTGPFHNAILPQPGGSWGQRG